MLGESSLRRIDWNNPRQEGRCAKDGNTVCAGSGFGFGAFPGALHPQHVLSAHSLSPRGGAIRHFPLGTQRPCGDSVELGGSLKVNLEHSIL